MSAGGRSFSGHWVCLSLALAPCDICVNRTAHVRQYTGERCDSIETQLRDIDVRHSKALETLEVRSREILAIARKNEQKIIALLHQIAPEPTTQS